MPRNRSNSAGYAEEFYEREMKEHLLVPHNPSSPKRHYCTYLTHNTNTLLLTYSDIYVVPKDDYWLWNMYCNIGFRLLKNVGSFRFDSLQRAMKAYKTTQARFPTQNPNPDIIIKLNRTVAYEI